MSPVNTIDLGGTTTFGDLRFTSGSTTSTVGVWVVQGSASSFTVIQWGAAKPGDIILTSVGLGAGASSMSSGLIPWSHCTQAGQIELRLSNVSTLVQNQTAQTFNFIRLSVAT